MGVCFIRSLSHSLTRGLIGLSYAASKTIPKGMILHNVTGWFLLPGKADERFIYNVRIIRDGGYSTRGVNVVQESDPGVCFTCICSFKKPEKESTPSIDIRQRLDLRKEFSAVLMNKQPHEHEEMPGVDAPWYWEFSKRNGGYTDPFPGLHLHKVDMDLYNNPKASDGLDHRNLKYYSVRGDMPAMGSLSHTVIFHGTAEEFDMIDRKTGGARWFCQEAWTGGARQGRGTHQSRMWADDGLHIATSLQDGMVRLRTEGQEGKPGFSPEAMIRQLESRTRVKEKL
ncbi:hypothetical protein B0A54_14076 [Friedmanniomyces endolithicus]|uniref:Acyl-CoA thioesterase-like C-terminal domain-containing protein n=1 Tax=Friedmanniomyces endolithicus TaxID=329885 RepID=A0A4U0UD12_9PEZI|nr:hypothetical protein B0A54_14076 [Friedmanniomyces endolithicus]